MVDFRSELGARARERLTTEQVIWLTTVAHSGTPHPHPVWFLWEGSTFLIYSQPTATIDRNPPLAQDVDASLAKYRTANEATGMTPETLSASFTVLLRAAPTKLRGME